MKQVILVRQDLKLPKGKLAAQVAHASLAAYEKAGFFTKKRWFTEGMKKVVLKVSDLEELNDFYKQAKKAKLAVARISDAGKTVVEPGTITCLGVGPDAEEKIDKVTGMLKIL